MRNVLVVEDNLELRELYRWLMESEGYIPLTASNGAEALEIMKKYSGHVSSSFCLIILDLMMPVMDGWEFLEKRALDPELASVPVVVCSAVRDDFPVNVDMIPKPINIDHLLAKAEQHCSCPEH